MKGTEDRYARGFSNIVGNGPVVTVLTDLEQGAGATSGGSDDAARMSTNQSCISGYNSDGFHNGATELGREEATTYRRCREKWTYLPFPTDTEKLWILP